MNGRRTIRHCREPTLKPSGRPRYRIGAVNYLNTKPLVCGLAEDLPDGRLSFELPSRLADLLADGELDVALAPCIELAAHPEWSVISTACIGSRGPVLSVKVMFRVPPADVATLALDEGSRTSAVLAQILLAERYGLRPQLSTLPIGADPRSAETDAVLVIGDRAIAPVPPDFHSAWDLGEQWRAWTGLPMVFAMWMARPGIATEGLEAALDAARDRGLCSIDEIAARESRAMGLSQSLVSRYLRDHLHFLLGPNERRGLDQFFQRAAQLGLTTSSTPWQFSGSTTKRC